MHPATEKDNHTDTTIVDSIEVDVSSKNNAIKERTDTIKNIIVVISSLSIIFLSVPIFCSALINFELENAGIKEKQEKKSAVAKAEKDSEADIKSEKLFNALGFKLYLRRERTNVIIQQIIVNKFLFNLPLFITITHLFFIV